MRKILFAFIVIFIFNSAIAQDYRNSIGVRLGPSNGISYKHFFSGSEAFEGLFSVRWGGFTITGLYERHIPVFNTAGMFFYYGAGGHIGFYNSDPWLRNHSSVTVIGIDGIVGLEYIFKEIPFNISLDYKPALNFIGYSGFWHDEIALSFRYIF